MSIDNHRRKAGGLSVSGTGTAEPHNQADLRDGLYVQGVKALASFGDDDGVDCALQRYVHDNAYKTAQPRDLLNAFTPTFPDAEAVLAGFGVRF